MTLESDDPRLVAGDINVVGDSVREGGRWRNINVMGDLVVRGDLRCSSLNCMGDLEVEGAYQARRTNVMGDAAMGADADAGDLNVMGKLRCRSRLRARRLSCMGELDVDGILDADEAKVMGVLRTRGDCNVDVLRSSGTFEVGGLLSVDRMEVSLWDRCRATELGGNRIRVRRRRGFLGLFRAWDALRSAWGDTTTEQVLEVDQIEGDELDLENVHARVVRGGNVSIGPGCRIGRLEHTGSFHRHSSARIDEVVSA
jgi:cytoskeletal protein CcmA (bactofilin family)